MHTSQKDPVGIFSSYIQLNFYLTLSLIPQETTYYFNSLINIQISALNALKLIWKNVLKFFHDAIFNLSKSCDF